MALTNCHGVAIFILSGVWSWEPLTVPNQHDHRPGAAGSSRSHRPLVHSLRKSRRALDRQFCTPSPFRQETGRRARPLRSKPDRNLQLVTLPAKFCGTKVSKLLLGTNKLILGSLGLQKHRPFPAKLSPMRRLQRRSNGAKQIAQVNHPKLCLPCSR